MGCNHCDLNHAELKHESCGKEHASFDQNRSSGTLAGCLTCRFSAVKPVASSKDCSKVAELDEEECDAKQGIAAAGMSAANLNFRHCAALHQQSKMRGALPAHNKPCAPCPSTTQALLQRKPLHRRCLTNQLTKQRREVKLWPGSHARKNTCRSQKTATSVTCAAATGKSFTAATRCAAATFSARELVSQTLLTYTAVEQLVLQPIKRIEGHVKLPGSKSLSNRILLLAALSAGVTEVQNLLVSDCYVQNSMKEWSSSL